MEGHGGTRRDELSVLTPPGIHVKRGKAEWTVVDIFISSFQYWVKREGHRGGGFSVWTPSLFRVSCCFYFKRKTCTRVEYGGSGGHFQGDITC